MDKGKRGGGGVILDDEGHVGIQIVIQIEVWSRGIRDDYGSHGCGCCNGILSGNCVMLSNGETRGMS
jgi:hypothetical protein